MELDTAIDEHDYTWDDPDYVHDDLMDGDANTDLPNGKGDGDVAAVKQKKTCETHNY